MLKKCALKARFADGFSGVLFAAIGAFSAGVSESANAQVAQEAQARVYSAGMFDLALSSAAGEVAAIDLSADSVPAIVAKIEAVGFLANNAFLFLPGSQPANRTSSDDLPEFGGTAGTDVLEKGDQIRFTNANFGGTSSRRVDITVRIYRNGAGAAGLFMARGEGEVAPSPAVPMTAAASALNGGFFLLTADDPNTVADELWTMTNVASPNAAGFVAVQCANGYISDDEVNCRLPNTDGECGMFYDGNRPIHDTTAEGNCRATEATDCTAEGALFFDGGMCVASCPEERPQQTGNTCRATEAADCTGDTSFFEGGECVAECSAGMEAGSDGIICEAATTQPEDPSDPNPPAPTPTTTLSATSGGGGGDDETKDLRNILGGVGVVMFFATWAFSDDLDNYAFSPSFGYFVNENGYSANAGGRVDFRKGEWSAYWSAGQTNANGEFGEFRYASGGEYKTDFWQASFSESVQGETADYDFSLSADLQGGIWSLSPVYRMHSRLEKGETETRNSLNLEGILEWNRWQIRPSAGFQWRRAEEFADNAQFRLEAVREF